MTFQLHPQLAKDTAAICDLKLCRVLLMNNQNFPWLILVPRQNGLREIFDLSEKDYLGVMQEVRGVTKKMASHLAADKMNVATLGNMVPQLHIHVIARFTGDAAWPNPVWNAAPAAPYNSAALQGRVQEWESILAAN